MLTREEESAKVHLLFISSHGMQTSWNSLNSRKTTVKKNNAHAIFSMHCGSVTYSWSVLKTMRTGRFSVQMKHQDYVIHMAANLKPYIINMKRKEKPGKW